MRIGTAVAFLEWRDGNIIFVPDRRMRSLGYTVSEVPFPTGAQLEYHVETGDRYFTGDHGQVLRRSLWVIEPTGAQQQILDSANYLNLRTTATNLQRANIPFRVIRVYDGQEGEHSEAEMTADYIQSSAKSWKSGLVAILIGTSSLWLGAVAGALVRNNSIVIAIGIVGYAVLAIPTMLLNTSKRTALIQIVSSISTYAAGYTSVFFVTRYTLHR